MSVSSLFHSRGQAGLRERPHLQANFVSSRNYAALQFVDTVVVVMALPLLLLQLRVFAMPSPCGAPQQWDIEYLTEYS